MTTPRSVEMVGPGGRRMVPGRSVEEWRARGWVTIEEYRTRGSSPGDLPVDPPEPAAARPQYPDDGPPEVRED